MSRRLTLAGRVLALLLVLLPSTAKAHEIHTTLTMVSTTSNSVTFTVRSFADDFSASVARHAGRSVPRDSSVRDAEVTRYVQARLVVQNALGSVLRLEPCGTRRQGDLYFACFRVSVSGALTGLRVSNRMLTETHADQVNIMQVDNRGTRRTLLFTRASAPATIDLQS